MLHHMKLNLIFNLAKSNIENLKLNINIKNQDIYSGIDEKI